MRFALAILLFTTAVNLALAQDDPAGLPQKPAAIVGPAPLSQTPPAVTPNAAGASATTDAAPLPGANSFTEAQARSRIEAMGLTDVAGLKLDSQSIWRGTAMKGGQRVGVALDFKGNVVIQ